MKQRIAQITLVVRDYDEAIKFYTEQLNFSLVQDIRLDETERWVIVTPPGSTETGLLLAQADGDYQKFLFLYTDDFWRDYKTMKTKGIRFKETPREETYGIVAVFEDLYGNLWDLLQPY